MPRSDETNDSFQGNFVVVSAAPPTPIPTLPGAGLAALVVAIVTAVVLLSRRRVA